MPFQMEWSVVPGDGGFFMTGLTIFVLACFVGYYVVWKVTPALHSPLMGITNAISSVIIVGAILAAGPADGGFAQTAWLSLGLPLHPLIFLVGSLSPAVCFQCLKRKASKQPWIQ